MMATPAMAVASVAATAQPSSVVELTVTDAGSGLPSTLYVKREAILGVGRAYLDTNRGFGAQVHLMSGSVVVNETVDEVRSMAGF